MSKRFDGSQQALDLNSIHTDTAMCFHLLKHTRLNVVTFLNELPKTQHDIISFTVDVNAYTNTLLSFTVGGVFKEVVVDDKSKESTRFFITVPAVDSGLMPAREREAVIQKLVLKSLPQLLIDEQLPVIT
ncbi:nuclear RNA export factor 1-like [Gouania willdenowi]|uniref:nuclear RNA export factor 1-like n=1 Tax=Gouania willdenowi TaxID=441366 RepID=UPI0010543465|nr:nuclear RNA export factor 1-like [Gouania willdenowi]